MPDKSIIEPVQFPEIVIAFAGAIGVNLESTQNKVQSKLASFGYETILIKLTDEMLRIRTETQIVNQPYVANYNSRIDYANVVRRRTKIKEVMAVLGVAAIRRRRAESTGSEDTPGQKLAYLVRQLKRPEEVDLFRKVYGRQFVLISIHETAEERTRHLINQCIREGSDTTDENELKSSVIDLINRDLREDNDDYGQNIQDTFPKGDLFIAPSNEDETSHIIDRFFELLFGNNSLSPTIDEYGMYLAKTASLRSIDLSRQVGASILNCDGGIVALGCNEVPKAGGGTYWSESTQDFRDHKLGYDPNEREKRKLLKDLIHRLQEQGLVKSQINDLDKEIKKLLARGGSMSVSESRMMDIIEYGRIIHAEMNAVTDAARFGRATKYGTLYCTTFPCHLCAKHIVSSGIKRVYYVEPYPKSYASVLHDDSISIDSEDKDKVSFLPFIGISPFRYRDLFEGKKRKEKSGSFRKYKNSPMSPIFNVYTQVHQLNEDIVMGQVGHIFGLDRN